MQLCEDIFTPDVERGQMEEKNVSWLIWKEHAILWENIWGLYCFAKQKARISSFLTLLKNSVIFILLC